MPPALVLAELGGMSGIPAATLDRVLGDIDGFQFGLFTLAPSCAWRGLKSG